MKLILQFSKAIIIGYGSIGKVHADYLKDYVNSIIVVDPIVKNLSKKIEVKNYPSPKFFESIDLLDLKISEDDIFVVSNWGPDHYSTIEKIIDLGAKKIVLEKPCADSLKELDHLKLIANSTQCKIVVNHYWYHLNLGNRINALASSLGLGEVVAIWITGGARCISTAGSHWINLANQIYKANPLSIFSSSRDGKINPRNKMLAYYDGIFSFEYANFKRLSISLTNLSSISGKIEIYWRDASAELIGEKIKICMRDQKTVSTKITLYETPTNTVFEGEIPKFELDEIKQMDALYGVFTKKNYLQLIKEFDDHLNTTKAILLALISSEIGQAVSFGDYIKSHLYEKKYGIS